MKRALVGVVAGVVAGACTVEAGPRLHEATPARAAVGARVQVHGDGFCGAAGDCSAVAYRVSLGLELPSVQAIVHGYSDTTADIQIPSIAPVGSTSIVLTVDGRSSNALDFEVLP